MSKYGAMDLHLAARASGSASAKPSRKADDSGLSARNILIRRKLMERKRFDSADHAMRQQLPPHELQQQQLPPPPPPQPEQPQPQPEQPQPQQKQQSCTPAQMGASALFNALGADENVDMDAAPAADNSAATAAAGRYGGLAGPAGGAASARNILLQKKLREKKHFDSADYQLAHQKPSSSSPPPVDGSGAAPMEIDLTPMPTSAAAGVPTENINSPSAASSHVGAQMSPLVRSGRYGDLSGANVLLARKLSEKKRFDSADYQMQAGPAAVRADTSRGYDPRTAASGGSTTSFFVPAPVAESPSAFPASPPVASSAAAPLTPAPVTAPPASQMPAGGSKYGKLSAVNVLIRKKLKERKRFDSADYAMEKQGHEEPASGHQGGSAGALRDGHVVVGAPSTQPNAASATQEEGKSINHQVKHIKLSEGGGGWATRVPSATAPAASAPSSGAATARVSGGYGSLSQGSRLAARNMIIQRKMSERKRFDSADYFKEAAKRGHSG